MASLRRSTSSRKTDFIHEDEPMERKNIPSIGSDVSEQEIALVNEAVREGWYENRNMHISQFEQEFKDYLGVKHCLLTSHGTSAIHLAFLSIGLKKGDEVIVPDLTWVASASPICYEGAKPVLVDVDRDDWCLSPEAFERAITKRTKAVMVVGIYGNMPKMQQILKIARKHKIVVIEDACESLGATYNGQQAGTFGDIGVFSFNATKLIMAGQGGALVTNKKKLFEKASLYAHHGINKKPGQKYYWSTLIGYQYNWTNLQAALALGQLRRIDEFLAKKKQIYIWYQERLGQYDEILIDPALEGVEHSHWLINAVFSGRFKVRKEKIEEELKKFNIDARPFFYPLSMMPPFKPYCGKKNMRKYNPVSYSLSPYALSLPCGLKLMEEDVDYVCTSLIKVLEKFSRK